MCEFAGVLDGDLCEPSEMPLFSFVFVFVGIDTGKGAKGCQKPKERGFNGCWCCCRVVIGIVVGVGMVSVMFFDVCLAVLEGILEWALECVVLLLLKI